MLDRIDRPHRRSNWRLVSSPCNDWQRASDETTMADSAMPQASETSGLSHDAVAGSIRPTLYYCLSRYKRDLTLNSPETLMANEKARTSRRKPSARIAKAGLVKKGDKVVKCQRCHGTGLR